MINKLSEKDEIIKALREKQTNDISLKNSINKKIDALSNNKTVTK